MCQSQIVNTQYNSIDRCRYKFIDLIDTLASDLVRACVDLRAARTHADLRARKRTHTRRTYTYSRTYTRVYTLRATGHGTEPYRDDKIVVSDLDRVRWVGLFLIGLELTLTLYLLRVK